MPNPLTREQMIEDLGSEEEARKYADDARSVLAEWQTGDLDAHTAWSRLAESLGWNEDGIGGIHSQDPFLHEGDREQIRQLHEAIPDTYFHGTRRMFEPGDLILPRSKKVAHATLNLTTAKVFGEDGRVYEVEPLDPTDVFTRKMKYTEGEVHYEALSETGFRVVRQVWQDNGQDRLSLDDAEDGFLRECDECGRITDAGDQPDWPGGVCERCDPSILDEV